MIRGSDHPAMLEAMIKAKRGMYSSPEVRLGLTGVEENSAKFPTIITCPSELVALSAALGYAQVTGSPVRFHLLLKLNLTDSESNA